jgi:signal transduction histidine kinase
VLLLKTLRSTTFKLALVSIALFGAAVVVLLSFVYQSTASYIVKGADQAIEAETKLLLDAYAVGGRDGLIEAIRQHIADGRFVAGFYLLADPSFTPVAGNLNNWPTALRDGIEGYDRDAEVVAPNGASKHLRIRARVEELSEGYHFLVGKNVRDLAQLTRRIKEALAIAVAFILVLAAVASVTITRRTVGRIEAINTTSRMIMESGLGKRIPLRGSGDEWDQLAQNLNLMFERIEALMDEIRQATDNVAHDLRTPLARMRARLERASIGERDSRPIQALIDRTIADLDVVLRIFSSLTRISQIEATRQVAAFQAVDIRDLLIQVGELFDAAAEEKNMRIAVVCDRPITFSADRDLLFDAFSNLIDNAIKYGREGGRVVIGASGDESSAVVFIADDGPGIPSDEFQNVFKRFYRLERSRGTPGNGLGLSLVAAVARLHGARVEMSDNAPGLKVELCFRTQSPFPYKVEASGHLASEPTSAAAQHHARVG